MVVKENPDRKKKSLLISPYLPKEISKFFDICLSEISSYSVTSKKTDETVLMVCKLNSIFDAIFKTYTLIKSGFTDVVKETLKKISALNSLRKKGTTLTVGEDELLAFTTKPEKNTRNEKTSN